MLTEAGLGRPLDDALGDMADRIGSENFGFVITAVTIQRQVGGSLADPLRHGLRDRAQPPAVRTQDPLAHRDGAHVGVHARRACPFFIGGIVSLMNPEYMRPLFAHVGRPHAALRRARNDRVGSLSLKKIVSFRG